MTALNKQALREMAERAASDSWGYDRDEFNDAITPEVVLALLDELEAKDKSISFLKDQLAQLANFNPDWDKLEAATDSLREHMAELTAARKRIAELERKEQHSDRQSVIDALASSGEEWSDIEEYMQKWDAERAAAAGKGEAS